MGSFGSSLWNQTFFGGDPGDPADAGFTVSGLLTFLYPRLHAANAADLVWWTRDEIVKYLDDAAKRLARYAGIFVQRSTRQTANGAGTYPLPPAHVSTVHVSCAGTPLRAASTAQLSALDAGFASATGTVSHWYQDTLGLGAIGLYKVPTAAQELAVIHHAVLDALTADSAVPAPEVLRACLADLCLADCYGKESDAAMPETAAFLRVKAGILLQAFQRYYGFAQ